MGSTFSCTPLKSRHIDHVFSVEPRTADATDECVPTQKFACWKGTSRLVYDASIDDEALHTHICSCGSPKSAECALNTGRIAVSGADATDTEAITFLFQERIVVANRRNIPSSTFEFGAIFGRSISDETIAALNAETIACKTISASLVLYPNQQLPKGEDCINVTCKKQNPEKTHCVLQELRVIELAELSGWSFQTMCDPYEISIQQLQIRPKLRSWSLQHDEFEYILQIHMWTTVCGTFARNQSIRGHCVDFLGHETQIAFDNDAVLIACVQTFNRIFPHHQPVCIVDLNDEKRKWAIVRDATAPTISLQNGAPCREITISRNRSNVQHLTAGPQIVHFREKEGCLQSRLYDERGRNDMQKLEDANILLALNEKTIPIRLDQGSLQELTMLAGPRFLFLMSLQILTFLELPRYGGGCPQSRWLPAHSCGCQVFRPLSLCQQTPPLTTST